MSANQLAVYNIVNPKSSKRLFSDGSPSFSRQVSYFSSGGSANVPLILPERSYISNLPVVSYYLLARDVSVSLSNIHVSIAKTATSISNAITIAICEAAGENIADGVRFFYRGRFVFGESTDRFEIDIPDIDRVVIHKGYQLCFMRPNDEESEYRFSAILSVDD